MEETRPKKRKKKEQEKCLMKLKQFEENKHLEILRHEQSTPAKED